MKKILPFSILLLLLTFHFSPFTPVIASPQISRPPSTIHIKLPKPKSREEAIQRIPDYIILNMILPPVIDRENLKKELFGNYNKEIEKLINEKKIDIENLTAIVSREMKKKDFSLKKLKEKLLLVILSRYSTSYDKEGITLGISAAVVVVLLSTLSLLIRGED